MKKQSKERATDMGINASPPNSGMNEQQMQKKQIQIQQHNPEQQMVADRAYGGSGDRGQIINGQDKYQRAFNLLPAIGVELVRPGQINAKKGTSQSMGPMSRVPRQNKSAPSQNSLGSALGPTSGTHSSNYYLRGSHHYKGGPGHNGTGQNSMLAVAANQQILTRAGAHLHHPRNQLGAAYHGRYSNHIHYQPQVVATNKAPLTANGQVEQTSIDQPAQPQQQQHGGAAIQYAEPTIAIEDSCDSQALAQLQQRAAAGLPTTMEGSQRSIQSSRRGKNSLLCEQMVAAYKNNPIAIDDSLVSQQVPMVVMDSQKQEQPSADQRNTLPPIPMSPHLNQQAQQQKKHYEQQSNSNHTESRRRGKGIREGLFPTLPGSQRGATNEQHSQSQHVDNGINNMRRRGGGPDGERRISNTQIIAKTKTFFDTGSTAGPASQAPHQANYLSNGPHGKKRGQVHSMKRTARQKFNAHQNRAADLLGSQSKEYGFGQHEDTMLDPSHPNIATIAQIKSAHHINAQNPQLLHHEHHMIGKREPIINGKTAKVRSAQGMIAQAAQQHESNTATAHENERFVQQCVTGQGNNTMASASNSFEQHQQPQVHPMGKTHLSIVGKPQHFTPVKQKLRLTFNQPDRPLNRNGLNQQHQNKHLRVLSKRHVIPAAAQASQQYTIEEGGAKHHRNAISIKHSKRLLNQRQQVAAMQAATIQSDVDEVASRDNDGIAVDQISEAQSSSYSDAIKVKNMQRFKKALNASSEKVNRRARVQSRPESAQNSAALSLNDGSSGSKTDTSDDINLQNNELDIVENNSSMLQSQEKVQQNMRSQKERYLEQIRKNEQARLQIQTHEHSYESPVKRKIGLGLQRQHSSVHEQSPRYAATGGGVFKADLTASKQLIAPQFSVGKVPVKHLTEEKGPLEHCTPDTGHPAYQIVNAPSSRPNYRVPANTMEKQTQDNEKEISQHRSPLVMRLSNQDSDLNIADMEQHESEEQQKFKLPLEEIRQDQQPIENKKSSKFIAKSQLLLKVPQNQNQSARKNRRLKLTKPSSSKSLGCVDPPSKEVVSMPTVAAAVAADFESSQQKSRCGSAQTAHQEPRSPKIVGGDITNITRRQSEVEIPPQSQTALSGTAKQLSFRQFKNPHRNGTGMKLRERSDEEAIKSEIATSDMNIENMDDLGQSQGIAHSQFAPNFNNHMASGHAFSILFDADSEGAKRDRSAIQIDEQRQKELQTVKRGQKIGEGSFGAVYQGLCEGVQSQYDGSFDSDENFRSKESNMLPPQMAIKVMRVEDKRLLSKLEAELELLRTLKHRHIVQYYGCLINEEEKEAQIFMELMPHSLQTQFRNFGPLHERVIKRHTKQILDALCYLHNHELRIIHGDLKAANILSDAGCTKLADFGDSRKLEALPQDLHASGESGAILNEFKGSILWMAPEYFRGKLVGRRSDIWSLGCTLIELASARRPWHGIRDLYHLIQKIEKEELPDIPSSLSPDAQDFIRKCLIYEKDQRPTAMELMGHAFVADGGTSTAQQTPAQTNKMTSAMAATAQI